jgi:hypothetical protein
MVPGTGRVRAACAAHEHRRRIGVDDGRECVATKRPGRSVIGHRERRSKDFRGDNHGCRQEHVVHVAGVRRRGQRHGGPRAVRHVASRHERAQQEGSGAPKSDVHMNNLIPWVLATATVQS